MKIKLLKKIIIKNSIILLFLFVGIGVVVVSCGGGERSSSGSSSEKSSASTQVVSEKVVAEAEKIFTTTCAACHGVSGRGDGPASKGLTPPPKNLSSAEWQDSVDDEYIAKIIQYGGGAVGKSIAMPNNPAIGANQELLSGLVKYVRSLKE